MEPLYSLIENDEPDVKIEAACAIFNGIYGSKFPHSLILYSCSLTFVKPRTIALSFEVRHLKRRLCNNLFSMLMNVVRDLYPTILPRMIALLLGFGTKTLTKMLYLVTSKRSIILCSFLLVCYVDSFFLKLLCG